MFDMMPWPGKIALLIGLGIVAFHIFILWRWWRGDIEDNVD